MKRLGFDRAFVRIIEKLVSSDSGVVDQNINGDRVCTWVREVLLCAGKDGRGCGSWLAEISLDRVTADPMTGG
jgi:hypothetical protein